MNLDPQARELNVAIEEANASVISSLSKRGKTLFFPKKGILSQSAEASECAINASIGIALEEDSSVMCLEAIAEKILLPREELFTYAPSQGLPRLRSMWKDLLIKKNPLLQDVSFSLPVVCSAITHGLSIAGMLFIDPKDTLILSSLYWENYDLIFKHLWQAELQTYETFTPEGTYNIESFRQALADSPSHKKILLFNFPNNPTGYSLTYQEAEQITNICIDAAEQGNDITIIIDDAYFGLVYEEGVCTQSLFSLLSNAHERILAVKIDGPTKEDYVWGFRIGFVTFGSKHGGQKLYQALENKCAAAIRSTISNSSLPAQSLLIHAFQSHTYEQEKNNKFEILRDRYLYIRNLIAQRNEFTEVFSLMPCNSGYFLCLKINPAIHAEELRQVLKTTYNCGVIVCDDLLRIAFSSTSLKQLTQLFSNIYHAGKHLLLQK